ncbi:MAG: protein-L-isoaspartate(D-aspartate) O-methyltransferase [Rhodospirillales bacterium]|nr:protein-L-isoaspartate(D-aspartate) O-methyltransferase [Rhodospirillales bacterium]MBO6786486.1 protein-L-isoaspartate(D-aspartate) O-methyltransferase [Rhodospirillales bacterium]
MIGARLDADTLRAALIRDGITDERVLDAIYAIPRDMFVPPAFKERSYENSPLPIGLHQTISQPTVVAMMTQALELDDRVKILEIGTGSGYQTAILAKLCRRVYTIERHRPLLSEAEARFDQLGFTNIVTRFGDGSMGWKEQAPFSRIIVTAAAIDVPQVLLDQLDVGGIMVVPVGLEERTQHLLRVRKTEDDIETEDLGLVRFVPLVSDEEAG